MWPAKVAQLSFSVPMPPTMVTFGGTTRGPSGVSITRGFSWKNASAPASP
jgi:hypothetical protein